MKCCLIHLVAILSCAGLSAQELPPAQKIETPKIQQTADFRKFLEAHKWSWPALPNGKETIVIFQPNGVVNNSHRGWGNMKYSILTNSKVKMVNGKHQTATMTFNPDYKTAQVVDFTGITGVARPLP